MWVLGLRFGNRLGVVQMHLQWLQAQEGQCLVFPGFFRSISFPSINFIIHIKVVNESLSICVQQEKNSNIKCFLTYSPGSGLFNKVTRGVIYTRVEAFRNNVNLLHVLLTGSNLFIFYFSIKCKSYLMVKDKEHWALMVISTHFTIQQ